MSVTLETQIAPALIASLPTGFEYRAEVRGVHPNRAIDLMADDQQTIIAYELGVKNWKRHVEQCHEIVGCVDLAYLVWGRDSWGDEHDLFNLGRQYRIGLIYCDGRKCREIVSAHRYALADPAIGRAAFDKAGDAGVQAGSPTGSANTQEAAYWRKLRESLPIELKRVPRLVGHLPGKGKQATRNAIKRSI
jgi:hypothetical protein